MNNADIVVAQYNEKIQWWMSKLDNVNINQIYVYTKNPNNTHSVYHKNIPVLRTYLPNIGREAHTYLYHIIQNYDNLGDFIFFLQASKENLSVPSILRINNLQKNNPNVTRSDNFDITNSICLGNNFKISKWRNQVLLDSGYNYWDWYTKFINKEIPKKPYAIYWQANFGIKKSNILSRPKSFYINLINQLNSNNTEVAHFLERSWFYVFNLQYHSR